MSLGVDNAGGDPALAFDWKRAMPKPYDRVKNADNHNEMFIRTPYWTPDVEEEFEKWCSKEHRDAIEDLVDGLLSEETGVSFKRLNGGTCCTFVHQPSKDTGLPCLLTGWSDNASDALLVSLYKLQVMMGGVWQEPPAPKPTRRR